MSLRSTRALVVELPDELLRDAKVDAAKMGISLKQWWQEAGAAKLAGEVRRPWQQAPLAHVPQVPGRGY